MYLQTIVGLDYACVVRVSLVCHGEVTAEGNKEQDRPQSSLSYHRIKLSRQPEMYTRYLTSSWAWRAIIGLEASASFVRFWERIRNQKRCTYQSWGIRTKLAPKQMPRGRLVTICAGPVSIFLSILPARTPRRRADQYVHFESLDSP